MSYFINAQDFLKWLHAASFSPISKNSVRKELLENLSNLSRFNRIDNNDFQVNLSTITGLRTILLRDGKGVDFSDDQILNWTTSVDRLIKQVLTFLSNRTVAVSPTTASRSLHLTAESNEHDEKKQSVSASSEVSPVLRPQVHQINQ